ncbi:MAG: type II secretion system protein [bacterium]|nr:type II secretion system protein [bacterium]
MKKKEKNPTVPSSILHPPFRRGFALVELLIAVALFGIISSFVLIAYNRVSGQLFLTTLAYEIALSFREAQSYGVSVHQFQTTGQTQTFDVGYGLHFDAGSANTYVLFADKDGVEGDARFNGGFGTSYNATGCLSLAECLTVSLLERGNTISKFCGVLPLGDGGRDVSDSGKNEQCNVNSLPASNPEIAFLDVTFLRPNPDAIITTDMTVSLGQKYKAARVYIVSPTGEKRVIEVAGTGQISLK